MESGAGGLTGSAGGQGGAEMQRNKSGAETTELGRNLERSGGPELTRTPPPQPNVFLHASCKDGHLWWP